MAMIDKLLQASEEVSDNSEHRPDGTYSVPQRSMDALRKVLREIYEQQEQSKPKPEPT